MINTIELFAGVGGFRIGLECTGGFNVLWANQWEPSRKKQDAYECYVRNFKDKGEHSNEDIATVSTERFKDKNIQLIVGGFPCQDYSVAQSSSNSKGIEGKKGVLFWEIVRFFNELKPDYLLLENVDRLLKSPSKQRGRDFSIMLASFRDAGYNVEWRVINAADYGNAQKRRRTFIFAYRNDLSYSRNQMSELPQNILHKTGFFPPYFPVLDEISEKKKPHSFELKQSILDISNQFSVEYLNAGIMINGKVYTEELIPVYEQPKKLGDILERNVDEKHYLTSKQIEKFKYIKGGKRIERTLKTGHTYIYSEGKLAFPDPLDKPGRTMLTSEASVNRSTHVIEDPETKRLRFLTPVECERMNGFPDNWTEGMSDRMRYFCMGNALVIPLVERMAKRILEINKEEIKN